MQLHFCTITSQSHLYKTRVLRDSILRHHPESRVSVLCVDGPIPEQEYKTRFFGLTEKVDCFGWHALQKRYKGDALRWSLKPVLIRHLLSDSDVDAVVYLDNDCYVVGRFEQLEIDLQAGAHALLSPHYYPADPAKEQNWLEANFRVGLYNAGFVVAKSGAEDFLDWWAGCCLYRMEKNYFRGLFDDQKYLDLAPVIFPNVRLIRHKGYNLAGWNLSTVKRYYENGSCFLEEGGLAVFIHFNYYTCRMLNEGKEPALEVFWGEYVKQLKEYNSHIGANALGPPASWKEKLKLWLWRVLESVRFK